MSPPHMNGKNRPLLSVGSSVMELFMAGDWELRTTFTGSVNDTVNPVVYVP